MIFLLFVLRLEFSKWLGSNRFHDISESWKISRNQTKKQNECIIYEDQLEKRNGGNIQYVLPMGKEIYERERIGNAESQMPFSSHLLSIL